MTDQFTQPQAESVSVGTYIDVDLAQVAVKYHDVFLTAQSLLNTIIKTPKRLVQVGNSIVNVGVVIDASVKEIDGPGGVLGRAGPTHILSSDGLPVRGLMEFDSADLDPLVTRGQIQDVVTHEMLHVIGCGPLWSEKNVLADAETTVPKFTGQKALGEYQSIQPGGPTAVPVEQDRCHGACDAHWDEQTFADELMTGYMAGRPRPLSRMSIASLADLGYRVDLSKADDFALPSPRERAALLAQANTFHLKPTEFEMVERLHH